MLLPNEIHIGIHPESLQSTVCAHFIYGFQILCRTNGDCFPRHH